MEMQQIWLLNLLFIDYPILKGIVQIIWGSVERLWTAIILPVVESSLKSFSLDEQSLILSVSWSG